MNKIKIVILLIAGLLLLSGCIENNNNSIDVSKTPTVVPTTKQPLNSTPSVTTIPNVTTVTYNTSSKKAADDAPIKSPGWCEPGAGILKAGKGLTIQGLVTDVNGTSLCYAKLTESKNGTNTTISYYFNENKTIERMNSKSTSSTGNASASANVSINKT